MGTPEANQNNRNFALTLAVSIILQIRTDLRFIGGGGGGGGGVNILNFSRSINYAFRALRTHHQDPIFSKKNVFRGQMFEKRTEARDTFTGLLNIGTEGKF